jgi:hypothetical protein
MKKEVHVTAALEHKNIADDFDKRMQAEKDGLKKIGLRTVATQNYFYAGINAIEAVLAAKDIHSFNHENRNRNMAENPELFDAEFYKLYNDIDRELRNRVAYRGMNGDNYKRMKDFATKAVGLL